MWKKLVKEPTDIDNLANLPNYGIVFFLKNMGEFKSLFILLTVGRVLATLLRFFSVYLLSDLVSALEYLEADHIFSVYLPYYIATAVCCEALDYFTRRHAEALPNVYAEQLQLRFYRTLLRNNSHQVLNCSTERLSQILGKYVHHVRATLNDWVWQSPAHVTTLTVVMLVLWVNSPLLMLLNLVYVGGFLLFSLRMSKTFSELAARQSRQSIAANATFQRFILHLKSLKGLGIVDFFLRRSRELFCQNWDELEALHRFHAKRWLIQLNLFRLLYVLTLFTGVYNVKEGNLPLGFLILLTYAFESLWQVLIYAVEHYVTLVEQSQDAKIVKDELTTLGLNSCPRLEPLMFEQWNRIELRDVRVKLGNESETRDILHIPLLELTRGKHIGIIGPSGTGKTTVLNVLLNLVPFEGHYYIDDERVKPHHDVTGGVSLINSADPLFRLTLRENLILGNSVDKETFYNVLNGTRIDDLDCALDDTVGDSNFNLSTGQEQRVRLARGLLQGRQLVLMDEAFNGIDKSRVRAIIVFLKKYLKDTTMVLVTHHPEELELVDELFEIVDGVLRRSPNPSSNHFGHIEESFDVT